MIGSLSMNHPTIIPARVRNDHPPQALIDGYRSFIPEMLMRIIPEDAYLRCSGRAFISISTVTATGGIANKIVSDFSSNEDLLAACLASCTIPLVSTKQLVSRFRGEVVLDGGCTNNLPVFTDGRRRQILFDMSGVEYPFALSFSPSDRCIESLVLRGAVEMRLFLLQRTTKGGRSGGGGGGGGGGAAAASTAAAAAAAAVRKRPRARAPRAPISWGRGDEAYGLLPSGRAFALRLAGASIGAYVCWRLLLFPRRSWGSSGGNGGGSGGSESGSGGVVGGVVGGMRGVVTSAAGFASSGAGQFLGRIAGAAKQFRG